MDQTLGESVAAGVPQGCVLATLKTGLSQQNGPDLAHRLTPLLLPEEKHTLGLSSGQIRGGGGGYGCVSLLLGLVGEPLGEFVESSRVLGFNVASAPQKFREVRQLLLFHLHLRVQNLYLVSQLGPKVWPP